MELQSQGKLREPASRNAAATRNETRPRTARLSATYRSGLSTHVRVVLRPAERIDESQLLDRRAGGFQKPRRGDDDGKALGSRDRDIQPIAENLHR